MKLVIINGKIFSVVPDDATVTQGDELYTDCPLRTVTRVNALGIAESFPVQDIGGPAPLLSGDALMTHIRTKRDKLLAACDWTQVGDSPLDAPTKTEWATYRTALRNFPDTAGISQTTPWPVPPA